MHHSAQRPHRGSMNDTGISQTERASRSSCKQPDRDSSLPQSSASRLMAVARPETRAFSAWLGPTGGSRVVPMLHLPLPRRQRRPEPPLRPGVIAAAALLLLMWLLCRPTAAPLASAARSSATRQTPPRCSHTSCRTRGATPAGSSGFGSAPFRAPA